MSSEPASFWSYVPFAIAQAALWPLAMFASMISMSSAPVSKTPTGAFMAALVVGSGAFLALGVAAQIVTERCPSSVFRGVDQTKARTAALGFLLPVGLCVLLPSVSSPGICVIVSLSVPVALIFHRAGLGLHLLAHAQRAGAADSARATALAGVLGLVASLGWLAVPAGALLGDELIVKRYGAAAGSP